MTLPPDLRAIRTRVALMRDDAARTLAVRGELAREALLRLCPSRLYLRDAQVRESLLLDERGRPIADVLVCADDEDYLLLVDGLTTEQLLAHVQGALTEAQLACIEDLSPTREVISLTGPWAWELVAETLGSDMIALPYMNFFRIDGGICVRAGRTGEFGYDLVVERTAADDLVAALEERGRAFELQRVSASALALCRFENWFFDPRSVPEGVTPVELQLQWRLDMDRDGWLGRAAVDRRVTEGVKRRLVCMLSDSELSAGDAVLLGDTVIGEVVRAEHSPLYGRTIAAALVDVVLAHGGIDRFVVRRDGGPVPVHTSAPPLVNNQSLYVDPRRHSFREVDELEFGQLERTYEAEGRAEP